MRKLLFILLLLPFVSQGQLKLFGNGGYNVNGNRFYLINGNDTIASFRTDSVLIYKPTNILGGSGITSINSDAGPAFNITNSTGIIVTNTTGQAAISVNTNDPWLPHVLDKFYTDVSNTGTSESDLYSFATLPNTLGLDGQSIHFEMSGTLNDAGATIAIQLYFGGTSFANTGALSLSGTGSWSATGYIMRTSSTTAKCYAEIKSNKTSDKTYVFTQTLTGLDFSDVNVFKSTGQAGGGGGGSNDITQTSWFVKYEPITL